MSPSEIRNEPPSPAVTPQVPQGPTKEERRSPLFPDRPPADEGEGGGDTEESPWEEDGDALCALCGRVSL